MGESAQNNVSRLNGGQLNTLSVLPPALLAMGVCLFATDWRAPLAAFVLFNLLSLLLGKNWRRFLLVFAYPFAFTLLGALVVIVDVRLSPFSVFLVPHARKVYILTAARPLGSMACLLSIVLLVPPWRLFSDLSRYGMPGLISELSIFSVNLIGTSGRAFWRGGVAQSARLGGHSFRSALQCLSYLLFNFFIRAFKQAEIMEMALYSRCYNGNLKLMPMRTDGPGWPAMALYLAVGVVIFVHLRAV
jgi:cobalt/nickel transport system permease protein